MDLLASVWIAVWRNTRRSTLMAAPYALMNLLIFSAFLGASSGRAIFEERFAERGGDIIRIDSAFTISGLLVPLISEELDVARQLPLLAAITSVTQIEPPLIALNQSDTTASSVELRAALLVTDRHFIEATGATVQAGRGFNQDDERFRRNVAQVGSILAAEYGLRESDRGIGSIRVNNTQVTVVGVLDPNPRLPITDRSVILNSRAALLAGGIRLLAADESSTLANYAIARSDLDLVESHAALLDTTIGAVSRGRHTVDYDTSLLRSYHDSLEGLALVLGGVMLLGVGAAIATGLHLQNSGYGLRRTEFGTRLALGQPKLAVASAILLESLCVSLFAWATTATVYLVVGRSFGAEFTAAALGGSLLCTLSLAAVLPLVGARRLLRETPADMLTP